jgi:hypothetical protein
MRNLSDPSIHTSKKIKTYNIEFHNMKPLSLKKSKSYSSQEHDKNFLNSIKLFPIPIKRESNYNSKK